MIENEFKIMLSKEQYDAIHTLYSWDSEVEQVNWYYDSESGELSGRHITCRVRTLGGRFYLQVKLPAHENSSGAVSRIELERELTSIPEFISGQELSEFSGAAGLPDVKLLGSLSTYRSVKRFDGAEIDLDKSEYFGRTDFELEVEYTDEASAQEDEDANQIRYHKQILQTIIELEDADEFIIALSQLIKRLAVDHLHIVGDIFDRGGSADKILDLLYDYHSLDIEWGNHDILWMGAACGNDACICSVIRNNLKYDNVEILENAYGISLRQLILFGMKTYGIEDGIKAALAAVTVILFKLEGQLIKAHPEYEMSDRLLLGQMDDTKNKVMIEGEWVTMNTNAFPTVDLENPYELTEEETEILRKLHRNFVSSQRLQKHIRFLYEKGSMYNVYNGNLIYHGCVPVDKNGAFDKLCIDGKYYHGKALLDKCEEKARAAYLDNPDKDDIDFMWFLWGGEKSPLCGRKLKTFEREYVDKESLWTEESNPYYSKYYDESFCCQILHEFGLYDDDSHIINGHTPVHAIEGENPVRAKGRLFVIDGGFCRSMNKATGIAGYTLIFNSHGLRLKAHTPFTSVEDALMNNTDIESSSEIIEKDLQRMFVKDTDIGKHLLEEISDLRKLLENYRRL